MPKYVFVINSHTTFLTSLGTIELLNLQEDDIVFLYMRNYKNSIFNIKWSCYDVTDYYNRIYEKGMLRHPMFCRRIIKELDGFVKENVCECYHLFVPHFGSPFFQILYTNPLCLNGSYIQEGGIPFLNAYITSIPRYKEVIYKIINHLIVPQRRFWYPCKWYVCNRLFKQNELVSYAISNDFFKKLPSINRIVKWPKANIELGLGTNSTVFIFDGFVGNKYVEEDVYLSACEKMISQHLVNNCYIKFHPQQSEEEKIKILSIFQKLKCDTHILDMTIPFELIITSVDDLTVIGLGSSLLYFARDLGHRVFCYDTLLNVSATYREYKKECGFSDFNS